MQRVSASTSPGDDSMTMAFSCPVKGRLLCSHGLLEWKPHRALPMCVCVPVGNFKNKQPD